MSAKPFTVGLRVDAETWKRLTRYEERTNHPKLTLVRAATLAALDYFDEHGETMPLPIKVIPMEATEKSTKMKAAGLHVVPRHPPKSANRVAEDSPQ